MCSIRWLLMLLVGILFAACAGPQSPPRFALNVPEQFKQKMERKRFRQGEALGNKYTMDMFPNFRAEQPQTWWRTASGPDFVQWSLIIERGAAPKVERALSAKDGYEVDLGRDWATSARIFPRFQHKKFAWGEAVSFLTQYQADRTSNAPDNDMLYYEVHGITSDRAFTVTARFRISHPRLPGSIYPRLGRGGNSRNYPGDVSLPNSPIRRDPDYRLVEKARDAEFSPSIEAIDAMLDGLKIGD